MSARDPLDAVAPRGAGGGSSSGGGTEQPDSLRSTQIADLLDLIGEGECVGLTNGLRSIYFDGVPLQNADGSYNFQNVQVQWVLGTQGQAAIAGADGVQTEVGVGVTVLATTPVVRTVTNAAVDRVRVTIAVPQLTLQDTSSGDLRGAIFDWAIDVQSAGGGFVQVASDRVDGKTTSRYTKAIEFKLPGVAPWDVRVRRITADSTSVARTDAFAWSTYTEIQSLKLRYPNSALVRTRLDAKAFSRVPVRAFDWMGIRVQVPSNYDPLTKTYTGVWNGTFKSAWTDCPAWLFYELVTNPRWGLGRYFSVTDGLKWEMYTIGRYCDGMVPDGKGGVEPRFRAGLVMSTREQAYKWLTDVAAIFRGMTYWGASDVRVTQDAPADVAAVFNNSNVIGGKFTYSGASHSKRHSQVVVWFNSLADFGKLTPEVVVDRALQAKYGIRSLEISPLGCWSRGQARRIGQWALYSEQFEGALCSHSVGFDGTLVAPGSIYEVVDSKESGERLGGRIRAATATQVTLDANVTLAAGEAYTMTVMLPDAADSTRLVPQTRPVTTAAGPAGALSVFPAFTAAPAAATVWVVRSTSVQPTTWRCLAVRPADAKNEYEITGIRHYAEKYALIEQGIAFEPPSVSRIKLTPPAPASVKLLSTLYFLGTSVAEKVTVSWPEPASGLTYLVGWRLSSGPWTDVPPTNANSVDIDQLPRGLLEVAVRSRNALGNLSGTTMAPPLTLLGKTAPAADVIGLASTIADTGLAFETAVYPQPDYSETELRRGVSWDSGIPLFGTTPTRFSGTRFIWPRPAVGNYKVWAKWIDTTGDPSANAVSIDVVVTAAAVLQWASIAGVPANLAGLTGTEAIRNADIIVGGYNLAQKSNDFSLFNQVNAGAIVATGQPDHLGATNATRLTCTSGQPGGSDRYRHFSGLRPGVTYTVSIWVKRETAGNFCLTPTNGIAWNTGTTGVVTATGWQRAIAQVQAGSSGVVDVALGGHSNGAYPPQQPGNVLIGYFQLEEGNAATQWGAAPEDIAGLINGAQQTADAANTQLAAIASDNVLTRGEKPAVILDWAQANDEMPGIDAQANAYQIFGGVHSDYLNAFGALSQYLQGIVGGWNNLTTDSPIDGTVFRATWAAHYSTRQTLLNKISAIAGTVAMWSGVTGIPYASILNNDDSAALGLQFEDWPAGLAYPTRWVNWTGAPPTRETVIVRIGKDAVRYASNGTDGLGMHAITDFRTTPLPLGTFLEGSIDIYMPTRTSGLPGILVRLGYGTNGSAGDDFGQYEDTKVQPPATTTGTWQRVPWSARLSGAGRKITAIRIFLMGSWGAFASGVFTGEVIFDNLIFALCDGTTDNKAIKLNADGTATGGVSGQVTISGLGYAGDLNATNGAPAGTYVGNQLAQDLVQTASNAQATAGNALIGANAANGRIQAIDSDGVLSRGEKPDIIKEWQAIADAYNGIIASANSYGIVAERDAFTVACNDLGAYLQSLSPSWADTSADTTIVPAVDRAKWAAVYSTRQVVLNKIAEVAGTRAQYALVTGRPLLFRVVSRGALDSSSPQQGGLFNGETGAELGGRARSYILTKFNRYSGLIEYGPNGFDVMGDGTAPARMAAQLNAATGSQIVVVYTWDEPMSNRLNGGMAAAMYRCGASRSVFGSPQFQYRSAYILVGIGGCGEGNGYEAYSGSVAGDSNAWCDVAFQLASGQLIISGTSATPRTLADYSYTGALDATNGAPAGTYVGGQLAQDLVQTANSASTAAGNAQQAANLANGRIQAIDSDGILSRGEKPEVIKQWQAIADAYPGIVSSANAYGIVTERDAFSAAYNDLSGYLSSLSPGWADTSADSTIVPAIDRAKWAAVYSTRQVLLNQIAAIAGTRAQWSAVSGINVTTPQMADDAVHTTLVFFDSTGVGFSPSA